MLSGDNICLHSTAVATPTTPPTPLTANNNNNNNDTTNSNDEDDDSCDGGMTQRVYSCLTT